MEELICDFMGIKYIPWSVEQDYERWDNLMPVFDKIAALTFNNYCVNTILNLNSCVITVYGFSDSPITFANYGKSRVKACYETIIEFIKWYNEK